MSMYAAYIEENTQGHVLETREGFASYVFSDEKTCYIKEVYVLPEFRRSGIASDIGDKIVGIAKERGCNKLLGSVVPSTKGATASLKFLLEYGFKLDSSTNDFVLFSKEIL